MKFAFLGDRLETFKRDHDSTWALMIEAVAQGHEVAYAHADTLISYTDAKTQVGARFLTINAAFVAAQSRRLVTLNEAKDLFRLLDDFDFVFMRKDPPVDDLYVQQLRMLTLLKHARVINDPLSLLCFNEKLVILEFPELIAPTLVSASREHIEGFLREQGRVVLKPLNGKGGEGVLLISSARELPKITELMMAQAYIPEVLSEGDKRVILVNGEVAGALLRIPKVGDFRANMAAGGSYRDTKLSHADLQICETLKPFCIEQGIVLAGIDIIGGKLTEINITSPTCLQEINGLNPDKPKIETGLIRSLSC